MTCGPEKSAGLGHFSQRPGEHTGCANGCCASRLGSGPALSAVPCLQPESSCTGKGLMRALLPFQKCSSGFFFSLQKIQATKLWRECRRCPRILPMSHCHHEGSCLWPRGVSLQIAFHAHVHTPKLRYKDGLKASEATWDQTRWIPFIFKNEIYCGWRCGVGDNATASSAGIP